MIGQYTANKIGTGEVVQGYYVCINETKHLIYTGYAETDCDEYFPDCHEIDPSTLKAVESETNDKEIENARKQLKDLHEYVFCTQTGWNQTYKFTESAFDTADKALRKMMYNRNKPRLTPAR